MDRTDKIFILSGFALALLTFALAFAGSTGCGTLKQVGSTVSDAASILCNVFAAEAAEADPGVLGGMTTGDYCAIHDNLKPFIDEALAAKNAAGRISLSRPSPSSADAGL